MEISSIILHIESLIFASDRPLTSLEITDLINQAFGFMEDKITPEQIDAAMNGIIEKYSSEFYPFEIRQSGGGWQFLTKKEFHKTVAQLNGEKFLKRLSPAALETLAIIAYKAPITKGEIEAIRGVSSDYSIQKLLEKELIIITGRNEKLPGHPLVYTTSKNFMDYFGINSPEDLPRIKEVLSDQVIPTPAHPEVEQSNTFIVSNHGELLERNDDKTAGLNGHDLDLDGTAAGEEAATGAEGRLFIDESFDAPENSTNGTGSLHPEAQSLEGESDDEEELGDADFELTDDGYGDSDDEGSEEDILEEMDLTLDATDDQEEDAEEADEKDGDDEDEDEEDADDMEGIEEEERELAEDAAAEDEDDQIITGDDEEDDEEDEEDEEDDKENGNPNHPKA